MPGPTLKEKLINKIKETDDPALLEELSHLLELQEPETPYELSNSQKKAIDEARQQVKNGDTLSNDQSDKETDEWLNE